MAMLALLSIGCVSKQVTEVTPRAEGERAPLTADCDGLDPVRCLLPFPSSAFTVADASTETGVRVAINPESLPTDADDPTWVNLADGFSRVTPIATGFEQPLDVSSVDGALHLYVAYADGAPTAEEIPLWTEVVEDPAESERLLIGYPLAILPANADLVVVVDDSIRYADGSSPAPERSAGIVAGTIEPKDDAEARLAAYHAPTRRLLDDVGIDPAHVYRAWDFTTRSADDPGRRIAAMLQVSAEPTVTIDSVETYDSGAIAAVVRGTLDGLPDFRTERYGILTLDADGLPVPTSTRSAPFRVVIPAGTGDYPAAMYGHGTGGDVGDSAFDSDMAEAGLAKVGIEFLGWDDEDLLTTVTYMTGFIDGTARSTSALLQTYSDVHHILLSLDGALGEALAADTIGGVANPAAGRHPDTSIPIWVGGSLGGTNGAVMVAAFPELRYGVVNVPAGAWSHIIPDASLYKLLVEQILHAWYPETLDGRLAIVMSQNAWDDVDGAAWEDPDGVLLIQESMGDTVVPNVGTAMLARARNATVVGPALDDLLEGLPTADRIEGATGITQYHTAATDEYDIHGFADTDYPAGVAAREQISAYLVSVLAGAPVIEEPPSCVDNGSCDFGD